jgi:dCTP deaminase
LAFFKTQTIWLTAKNYQPEIVKVTPFEPEWKASSYPDFQTQHRLPARIYANGGLCQIIFFQWDEVCEISNVDRKGKGQTRKGIALPKL